MNAPKLIKFTNLFLEDTWKKSITALCQNKTAYSLDNKIFDCANVMLMYIHAFIAEFSCTADLSIHQYLIYIHQLM